MRFYVIFIIFIGLASRSMGYDYDLPEKDVSLFNMTREIDEYKKRHHRYPTYWSDLAFHYGCYTYDKSDNKFLPPRDKSWMPKKCKFRYVLDHTNGKFQIDLYDDDGKLSFVYSKGIDNKWIVMAAH